MAKATTIKDALKAWEERNEKDATKAKDIGLQFQYPPIEKMDNTLSMLKECQKLSLSTNAIEKIGGLSGLKNLKILSLARNYIKTLAGIEVLADTLEQLWLSYNLVEKLKGIEVMKALKIFYLSNNLVKEWGEFMRLSHLPKLVDLVFFGNPLVEHLEESAYVKEIMKRLPALKTLDGVPLVREEDT